MSNIKRVVIDTNILLDILHFNDIRIVKLKDDIEKKKLEAWTCPAIWEEFIDVMHRPHFFSTEDTFLVSSSWGKHYFKFEDGLIPKSNIKCRDKDDQIFIDLALFKSPCILISKDLEVLRLKTQLKNLGVHVTNLL